MSARTRLIVFVAVFLLLYGALQFASGFQRWFIDDLTVPLAAWAINTTGVSPVPVHANGSRLVASGGGLNVLQGCEGLDLLCLWIAAATAGPFTWRARLLALTLGTALVFALNQVRLVSLYHLYRSHRDWFGDAHGLWWPLALVGLVWALFALWQRGSGAPTATAAVS
jgi:exosortase/archaeosortase family protein